MSYPEIPKIIPGTPDAERAVKQLLGDLAGRKEFRSLRSRAKRTQADDDARAIHGFRVAVGELPLLVPGFGLHGSQLFVRSFFGPDSPYTRLLVVWQTGTGKTIAAVSLIHEFVRQFRAREHHTGAPAPSVFVVGFTRSVFIEEMLRHPELGFVSATEVETRRRLRIAAELAGPDSPAARHLSGYSGVLRRRITDRARGGYCQFYGYKEFASRLLQVTKRGAEEGFDPARLYARAEGGGDTFGQRLAAAVRKGLVIVNEELLESMRRGLLICDEIHNTINKQAKNNYGVAIQYALDVLDDEIRAAFLSATPVSGSAEEIVDLGNVLVPRSALPGGAPLRREDFFLPPAAAHPLEKTGGDVAASVADTDTESQSESETDTETPSGGPAARDHSGRGSAAPPASDTEMHEQPDGAPDSSVEAGPAEAAAIEAAIESVAEVAAEALLGGCLASPAAVPPSGEALSGCPAARDNPERGSAAPPLPAIGAAEVFDASTLISDETTALSGLGFEAEAAEDDEDEIDFPVSRLLPGAAERIAHLFAGRVSFLLDTDVASYPRRELDGAPAAGIDYLSFVRCPMSPLQEATLKSVEDPGRRTLPANAHALYDMVFPNPVESESAGLGGSAPYNPRCQGPPSGPGGLPGPRSGPAELGGCPPIGLYAPMDVLAKISGAAQEWRDRVGVGVARGADAGLPAGVAVVAGAFLRLPALKKYSGKYAVLVEKILENIRGGPGKILVYHHRVRTSGVLLVAEALRANGLIDEQSTPTAGTICAVCGEAKAKHDGKKHEFAPARFSLAHSHVERTVIERAINRFNSPANLDGDLIRVFVGSRIIREATSFRAVNYEYIVSLPTDIPTLIQVMGRTSRKNSHVELPPERQFVRVSILVSDWGGGPPQGDAGRAGEDAGGAPPPPELRRYAEKMQEYLVIQTVMRALYRYAVDGFANYGRMTAADPTLGERATLEALPYRPAVEPEPERAGLTPAQLATFEAYGHGEREVQTIAGVLRVLFRARPVWKRADLWAAVRSDAVRGVETDPALFAEGNFALALRVVGRPWGRPPAAVVEAPPFLVLAAVGPGGAAADAESYLREGGVRAAPMVRVRVGDYLSAQGKDKRLAAALRDFGVLLEKGQRNGDEEDFHLALVDVGAAVHAGVLRRLVERAAGTAAAAPYGEFLGAHAAALAKLYDDARVTVTAERLIGNLEALAAYRGDEARLRALAPETPVGYVSPRAAHLYAAGGDWQDVPLAALGYGRRYRENDVTVGFVAVDDAKARFKVRPPLQQLRSEVRDARSLMRGAVCESRPRAELQRAIEALGGEKKTASTSGLCRALKLALLGQELAARRLPSGMIDGLRFVYLWCDRQPVLSTT